MKKLLIALWITLAGFPAVAANFIDLAVGTNGYVRGLTNFPNLTVTNESRFQGGIESSLSVTNATKNISTPLVHSLSGVSAIAGDYVWNGSAWISDKSSGFGYLSILNNTGGNVSGFGGSSLRNNTGAYANGLGYQALFNNTGANANGFGSVALFNNTGASASGFGHAALQSNTGNSASAFGYGALQGNSGDYAGGFGYDALYNNVGNSANGFGSYALYYNNWPNVTAFGGQSLGQFFANAATAKAFYSTNLAVDTITIVGHGFGATGTKVNLRYTTTAGTPPTGLAASGTPLLFTIASVDSLILSGVLSNASDGTFIGTLENSVDITGSTAIGFGSTNTAANQLILGGANISTSIISGIITGNGGGLTNLNPPLALGSNHWWLATNVPTSLVQTQISFVDVTNAPWLTNGGSFTGNGAGLTNLPGVIPSLNGFGTNTVFYSVTTKVADFSDATLRDTAGNIAINWTSRALVDTNGGALIWGIGGGVYAPIFYGDGSGLTNLTGVSGQTNWPLAAITNWSTSNAYVGSFTGNGAALTNLPIQTSWTTNINMNGYWATNLLALRMADQGITWADGLDNTLGNISGLTTTNGIVTALTNRANNFIWASDATNNYVTATFPTPGVPLRLSAIQAWFTANNPGYGGTVFIQIYASANGLPVGPVLAQSGPLVILFPGSSVVPRTFTLLNPVLLSASTNYSVVIVRTAATGAWFYIYYQNTGTGNLANSTDGINWVTIDGSCQLAMKLVTDLAVRQGGSLAFYADQNKEYPLTNMMFGPLDNTNVLLNIVPGIPPTLRLLNGTNGPANLAVSGTITGNGAGLTNLPAVWGGITNPATGGDKLTILANGNVGIGTTAPTHVLDVNGTFSVTNASPSLFNSDVTLVGVSADLLVGGNTTITGGGAGTLGLQVGSTTLVVTNGNVGIGTTTPVAKLDVKDGRVLINYPSAINDADTEGQRWAFGTDGTLGTLNLILYGHPSATAGNRYVNLQAGDSQDYRSIVLNPIRGNVGIGTTAPAEKLSVIGNVTASGIITATNLSRASMVMSNSLATLTTTATPLTVTNWTRSHHLKNVGASITAGTLTVTNTGTYLVHFDTDYDTDSAADTTLELYLDAVATGIRTHHDFSVTTITESASVGDLLDITAGQVLSLKASSVATENLTFFNGRLTLIQQPF